MINIESAINYELNGYAAYISPATYDDPKYCVYVFNNSSMPLNVAVIYADYGEDKMLSNSTISELDIESYGSVKFPLGLQTSSHKYKCMLWDSVSTMKPLCYARTIN